MTWLTRFLPLLILLPIFLLTTTLTVTAEEEIQLGKIDFPTSAGPQAQKHFLRGVLYLHSFEYRDARDAFRAAREAEPGFAMAYWGEAMTFNHPIWLEENVDEAREALSRLAPTPEEREEKAPTKREKGYLKAVEILFGDGDKRARDHAYSGALAELSKQFPDDLDARSFYALSILGTCHDGRDTATYMRAAAVVEEVFAVNPEHPGAAHYLIHSYDDAVHAPLGLRAARVYAEIAPAAGHALHMPSHVFLALGMWDETVASNIDSWEAVEARVKKDKLPTDRRNYHSLLWLQYAYLQQGRMGKAKEQLEIIKADAARSGSVRARSHYALMRGAYITGSERWEEAGEGPDLSDLRPAAACADLFATGLAAVRTGRVDAARAAHQEMGRRISQAREKDRGGYSDGFARVGPARTASSEAMASELEGLILLAEGKTDDGLAALARAMEIEGELPFGFGPPVPVKPSRELYAEALLALGHAAEARAEFQQALVRTPKRALALRGLKRATEASGGVAGGVAVAEMGKIVAAGTSCHVE